jgi:3-deoxy-D-manno-octulosonate 8-phosphate phosphatase (KDO 8-P phosphatase)
MNGETTKNKAMSSSVNFSAITTFIFDMDGVLTDGTLLLFPDLTTQARKMHIKDGYALQLAIKKGYRIKVISGSFSEEVKTRLAYLGVKDVSMSVKDKRALLLDYMNKHQLRKEEVLYMGDDVPDWEAMKETGLPTCPRDAALDILSCSLFISSYDGGKGCVREVIENVLRARGHWDVTSGVRSL